jgi:hypothetical protein
MCKFIHQVQQPSYSVTTDNSVTLICTVSSSLPITSVQWQRNIGGSITTINSIVKSSKLKTDKDYHFWNPSSKEHSC